VFLALRRKHGSLLPALNIAAIEGLKRTTTVLDARTVRWTITRQPSANGDGKRYVILAQDEGIDEDVTEPSVTQKRVSPDISGDDDDYQSSTGSRTVRYPPSSHGTFSVKVNPTAPPPSATPAPSSANAVGLISTSIPRPPDPDRSWMKDSRFSAIATAEGEMGELVRSLDWAQTPLGHVSTWCPTLLTMFGVVLHSQFPSAIWWGPLSVLLYNSSYVSILGPAKHPWALGRPATEVWPELWDGIKGFIENTLAGQGCYFEDDQLLIRRSSHGEGGIGETIEEAYFTWSYIPLHSPGGAIGGVYNMCPETTGKVRSERRMGTLCQLATRLFAARTTASMIVDTCEVIARLEEDIPYVAAYAVHKDAFVGRQYFPFRLCRTLLSEAPQPKGMQRGPNPLRTRRHSSSRRQSVSHSMRLPHRVSSSLILVGRRQWACPRTGRSISVRWSASTR
jgi:hypothetical protein